jgi:hypothetical protein
VTLISHDNLWEQHTVRTIPGRSDFACSWQMNHNHSFIFGGGDDIFIFLHWWQCNVKTVPAKSDIGMRACFLARIWAVCEPHLGAKILKNGKKKVARCSKTGLNCPVVGFLRVLKPLMTQYRPESFINSQFSVKTHFFKQLCGKKAGLRPDFERGGGSFLEILARGAPPLTPPP